MRKVAIIGTVGIPAKYGGFETLVEYLTKEKSQEFDFTVYCSSKAYEKQLNCHNRAKLRYLPLKANGVQSIPYDMFSILEGITKADTLLVLGVSGCLMFPFVKFLSKKKIIVNIDGLEWKRDKWGKAAKSFLKLSEKVAVNNADIVIADNKVIQDHVKNNYGKRAELIAYGADHCAFLEIAPATLEEFPFLGQHYAFKVCRIEPENNIHLILEAFKKYEELNLVLVGNWDNSGYALNLKEQFGSCKNIFLLNPIYNQNKLNQLRSNCYVYIHGHSAGGTNPSLVEAMHLKLPILAYGINYNQETTAHRALYFNNESSLIKALQNLNMEKLEEVADQMYEIAKEKYVWKKVAEQYAKLF